MKPKHVAGDINWWSGRVALAYETCMHLIALKYRWTDCAVLWLVTQAYFTPLCIAPVGPDLLLIKSGLERSNLT